MAAPRRAARNRMLKDRQEILALGELVLLVAAWMAGILAVVDHCQDRNHVMARNNVASSSDGDISNERDLLE